MSLLYVKKKGYGKCFHCHKIIRGVVYKPLAGGFCGRHCHEQYELSLAKDIHTCRYCAKRFFSKPYKCEIDGIQEDGVFCSQEHADHHNEHATGHVG